jgi:branched-chain amino acid transport system permease protein
VGAYLLERLLSDLSFIALYGISYGIVLYLMSVGLVVTMGLMRVINLAHGAFAALGGYATVLLMTSSGVPFFVAIPIAVLAVAAFSLVIERLIYVQLYRSSELNQVLMTIGLLFITAASLNAIFGPNLFTARLPVFLDASVDLGFRQIQVYRLAVVAAGIIVIAALWLVFERTSFGAKLRAAVDNRTMTEAIGVNVTRLFSTAFAIGSGLAALGGAIGFPMLPLEPLYPFKYLTLILIVVTLSGFGQLRAAVVVALIVGVADTAGRYLVPSFGAFFIYILLIGLLLWRRDGLFAGKAP